MSAPESIRKGRLKRRQKRERDPEEEDTALTEEEVPGEGSNATVSRRARFPGRNVKQQSDLEVGWELGVDEPSPSCDKLMGPHNGKNSSPNERDCCTRNAGHEEDDHHHGHDHRRGPDREIAAGSDQQH